jgi:MFS family permease
MLKILRRRNYSLLWFAGLISIIGDWSLNAALPYYVYQNTGSVLATGLMVIARTLPGALIGNIAGVLVDRWDRKWTMVVVNAIATFLVFSLLLVNTSQSIWFVYFVAFIESSIKQFFYPAEKALLPVLVPNEYFVTANSLNSLNSNLAMFIGPSVGGMLMGFLGLKSVVIFDSITYLIAAIWISLISYTSEKILGKHLHTSPMNSLVSMWNDWKDGLRLSIQIRPISTVLVAAAIALLGDGMIQALLFLFVNMLKGGAMEYGWILTMRGLGGLLGGLLFARFASIKNSHHIFPWTLAGMGLLAMIMCNIPFLALSLISICLIGILAIGANVTSTTMIQNSAPNQYLGRIFGILGVLSSIVTLLGQGSSSILAGRFGVVPFLNLAGILYFLSGIIAYGMLRKYSNQRL